MRLAIYLQGYLRPLAFIWLVVGYFMQAKELALTRIELVGQSKAQERLARETEIANENRMAGLGRYNSSSLGLV